jgi:cell division protein FtsL
MIYLRIALDRTAFELDSIERAITTEESRQLDLRLTIAQLQDPVRIATEAERIGMTTPNERIPIVISSARGVAPPTEPESPVSAFSGGRP